MPRDKATLESEFSKNGVSDLFIRQLRVAPLDRAPRSIRPRANASCSSSTSGATPRARRTSPKWTSWATAPRPTSRHTRSPRSTPELQRQFWIVALGSSALGGDDRGVAMLDKRFRQAHLRRPLVRRRVVLRPPVPVRPQVDLGPSVTRPFQPEGDQPMAEKKALGTLGTWLSGPRPTHNPQLGFVRWTGSLALIRYRMESRRICLRLRLQAVEI